MHHKSDIDLAIDVLNSFLEVLGPRTTVEIAEAYIPDGGSSDQAPFDFGRFADVEIALLGDPSARRRFVDDIPSLLQRHGVADRYPELAAQLLGPPTRDDPG